MSDVLARLRTALAGRYALERELGRGGMATVWLAEEHHPRRQVALKVLDPAIAAALGPERFLREVDLAAKLTHPHILSIYSAGDAEGLLYYTMPYVEGESLRDRLSREKQLPLDDAHLRQDPRFVRSNNRIQTESWRRVEAQVSRLSVAASLRSP